MSERSFRILGQVVRQGTINGIPGLRVEAWDKDLLYDDLVGSAITDAQGRFQMEFSAAYFREIFLDRHPDLYFKVFRNGQLLTSTENTVRWNQRHPHTEISIPISIAAVTESWVVKGHIRQTDGSPLAGVFVEAFDRDLRQEHQLGSRQTSNAEGYYEITYSPTDLRRPGKKRANLIVRVYAHGATDVLLESAVILNARSVEIVNLGGEVRQLSEYEQLLAKVLPRLDNAPLQDLTGEEIAFLATEANLDPQHLAFLVLSTQLAATTQLRPEAFYALLRHQLPTRLLPLLAAGREAWTQALDTALDNNIIPPTLRSERDALCDRLQHLADAAEADTPAQPDRPQIRLNYKLLRRSVLDNLKTTDPSREFINTSLNARLKNWLAYTLISQGYTTLAAFTHTLPDVDLTTQADVTLRAFMATQVEQALRAGHRLGLNTTLNAAVQTLSTTTTLGQLLELDQPLQSHTLFSPRAERLKFRTLLDASPQLASRRLQATFIQRYTENQGSIQDFWKKLREDEAFQAEGLIDDIQFTLLLDRLTGNNVPLIRTLRTHASTANRTTLRQLATLTPPQWQTLLETSVDGDAIAIPEEIVGATLEEKRTHYAHFLRAELERAFPMDCVVQGITTSSHNPLREQLATFFANVPEFDFRRHKVDAFLAAHGDRAFQDIPETDRKPIQQCLKQTQRLFAVTPRYEHIETLQRQGLNSAATIARTPPHLFAKAIAAQVGGETVALAIHENAQQIHGTTLQLFVSLYQAIGGVKPFVMGGGQDAIKLMPTWTNLFGSLDLCECEHGKSLYSPAAYFVDLLQFLNPPVLDPSLGSQKPLEVLLKRRPDLESIELTSENALTPLPYIDLVNEILEFYVAHHHLTDETAQNTGTLSPEELAVNPQHTISQAYQRLQATIYPFSLPFHQPVEVARVYLEHLGTSLFEVMAGFRPNNTSLKMQAIAAEYLKITPAEFRILTWSAKQQLLMWFYGYGQLLQIGSKGAVVEAVKRTLKLTGVAPDLVVNEEFDADTAEAVRQFQRRHGLGVTGKVNAKTWSLLWKLIIAQVPEFLQQAQVSYLELIELIKTRFINANRTIVLYSPSDSQCDLTVTRIQYQDGQEVGNAVWSKLHRLIRLWRKLGWSIADVDRTLTALKATDITPNVLWKLAQVQWLKQELKLPVEQLLTLWANIDTWGTDTWGEGSLYAKLFLNKAARAIDPAFQCSEDDVEFLQDESETISGHVSTLLGAFRVSAADFDLIRADAGLTNENAPLTLGNVSKLYRYTVLAKALKLKIKDFIGLKTLADIDPFKKPLNTQQFVTAIRKVEQSDFSIAQLSYLYRHLWDATANVSPDIDRVRLLAQTLREGLLKIAEETMVLPNRTEAMSDPTGEMTRAKLSLLFDAAIVDQTIRLIDGSAIYQTALDPLVPANFSEALQSAELAKNKVFYDTQAKALCFKGTMTQAEHDELIGLSEDPAYLTAANALQQQPKDFIQNTLTGFLNQDEAITNLLNISSLNTEGKPNANAIANKFSYFLTHFLPYLCDRLSRSFVKQTLREALNLTPEIIEYLLENWLKSQTDPKQSAIADILALTTPGLSFTRHLKASNTETGVGFSAPGPQAITLAAGSRLSYEGWILIPNNGDYALYVQSAIGVELWLGDNPDPFIDQIKNATDQELSHPEPITLKADQLYALRLELNNSSTHEVTVNVELAWRSDTLPKERIPRGQLYPATVINTFANTYILLDKVAQLVNGFELTLRELTYLANHPGNFGAKTGQTLPINRLNPTAVDSRATALFQQWLRLCDLVTLRNSLPTSEIGLFDIFEFVTDGASKFNLREPVVKALAKTTNQNPDFVRLLAEWSGETEANIQAKTVSPSVFKDFLLDATALSDRQILTLVLAIATGWDVMTIKRLLTAKKPISAFRNVSAFRNEIPLLRLQTCLKLVQRTGASAEQLLDWVQLPWRIAPEKAQGTAQDIKNTVRAKYDDATWRTVAQPLNDTLRERQRDALIAYILPVTGHKTANQLLEYFLIDVNMNACMMTTRIKQAIASVQLFIQRCLMNLEPGISPEAISDTQWEWMQRYRVWEANRKIFLYPENWIEPELRDDKSPFFKELESELLQNDLTDANIEKAFLSYLKKLDEVARLHICGMYWEGEEDGRAPGEEILHVFGRGYDSPNIYYRQLDNRTNVWTAWERVNVDIDMQPDGVHLMPIVFNRRLYLFWPIFTEKPYEDKENPPIEGKPPRTQWEIQLAWSEYWQNKWSSKQLSAAKIRSFAQKVRHDESLNSDGPKITRTIHFSQESDGKAEVEWIKEIVTEKTITYHSYLPEPKEHLFLVNKQNDSGRILIESCIILSGDRPGCLRVVKNIKTQQQFSYSFNEDELADNDLTNEDFASQEGSWDAKGKISIILASIDMDESIHPSSEKVEESIISKTQSDRSVVNQEKLLGIFEFSGNCEVTTVVSDGTSQKLVPGITAGYGLDIYFNNLFLPDSDFSLSIGHTSYGVLGESDFPAWLVLPLEQPAWIGLSEGAFFFYQYQGCSYHFGQTMLSCPVIVSLEGFTLPISMPFKMALKFEVHYHPFVSTFISILNRDGVPGLFEKIETQKLTDDCKNFKAHNPQEIVHRTYPVEKVDFDHGGTYSLYNWELFFHIPLMIATRLTQDQRFAEAQKWFHYIFNPTDSSSAEDGEATWSRYWKVLPFRTTGADTVQQQMESLSYSGDDTAIQSLKLSMEQQITEWRDNPFKPHLIARLRLSAYQKTVVMKYIDNLIAWGDQLFRQDTIETINEATQLYILAYNILGPRPERIPPRGTIYPETFASLKESLDEFSNALVLLAEAFPYTSSLWQIARIPSLFPEVKLLGTSASNLSPPPPSEATSSQLTNQTPQPLPGGVFTSPISTAIAIGKSLMPSVVTFATAEHTQTLYFCIPQNDNLLIYWDTVADRLFKIRHCMNIEGIVRQLPLYEPPIDPGLLVRAAAAGVDISSVLNDMNAPLPPYRFSYMLQKALEMCAEVKALGSALLSTLEKQDAEELSTIRASQEAEILNVIRDVKVKQLEEASENKKALEETKKNSQIKHDFYAARVQEEEEHKRSNYEDQQMQKFEDARDDEQDAEESEKGSSILKAMGNISSGTAGWPPGPLLSFSAGLDNIIAIFESLSRMRHARAAKDTYESGKASTLGQWFRRTQEWQKELAIAKQELVQIEKQILGADVRIAIATKELLNHDQQVENAKSIENFLQNKYTNQELYTWMKGQISALFFQSYQLAYDLAKRAERTYRFELGLTDSNFIKFGYWDNLRQGLLSGDKLYHDLKRLELSYLEQHKREYELTKPISLLQLNPLALILLKATGQCEVDLPEWLFDLDYPGHYMRRIKNVSITIPCVAGPYTSVSCTLTLLSSEIRIKNIPPEPYPRILESDDDRFLINFAAMQSIATSTAQNDSGLFELNFRDERYLPFEGAGAISRWRIELPKPDEFPQFDYNTISDVVLQLRYTAREGGEGLKTMAVGAIQKKWNPSSEGSDNLLTRLFSAKHEFSDQWHRFLHPKNTDATYHALDLELTKKRFPFPFQTRGIVIRKIQLFLKLNSDTEYSDNQPLSLVLKKPDETRPYTTPDPNFMVNGSPVQDLPYIKAFEEQTENLGVWLIEVPGFNIAGNTETRGSIPEELRRPNNPLMLNPSAIDDLIIVCHYSVQV